MVGVEGQPADAALTAMAAQFRDLVKTMSQGPDGELSLVRVVQFAAAAVPGGDHAAITLSRGKKRPQSLAATGELPRQVDALEFDLGEGPCLQALSQSEIVCAGDLAHDHRWPRFGPRAVEATGVRSMLSFRLFLTEREHGALNLYTTRAGAFGDEAVATGSIFAAYASLLLTTLLHEDRATNLERALQSNREIGMALGVLVARELWTPDQAFDRLREASQRLHRKLRDIADEVVRTGELPAPPPPPSS